RAETVKLTVAAVITDRLPNGNLVIGGRQEVMVNNELRELLVSGVIRPEDIASDNTIEHTKIAEARISYGGKGQITDQRGARSGQKAVDKVLPFWGPGLAFRQAVELAAAHQLLDPKPDADPAEGRDARQQDDLDDFPQGPDAQPREVEPVRRQVQPA